jgi:hypothetical protein
MQSGTPTCDSSLPSILLPARIGICHMSSWPAPPPPAPLSKSRRRALVAWLALAAIAVGVILASLGKGSYHDYRLSSAAIERFHQQLDAADYDGIYAEATDEFRKSGKQSDLIRFLETVHNKMGNSGKTSTIGFHVKWNNGRFWVDRILNTQFAQGQGQESFIWIVEQDHLGLYGYRITSPNLR